MSVAQPRILLAFDDASGSSITNYGTQGTAYVIQQGSSPTDYERFATGGAFSLGRLQTKTKSGANTPYFTNAGTAPSSGDIDCNFAMVFKVTSFNNGVAAVAGGNTSRCPVLRAESPAGSGDFDLSLTMRTVSGYGYSNFIIASACTFGTTYHVAATLKCVTSNTQLQLIWAVNAGSATTEAAVSDGSEQLTPEYPFLNVGQYAGFTNYYGLDGEYYMFAFDMGAGIAWSASDIQAINADPAFITGFPTVGNPTIFPYLMTNSGRLLASNAGMVLRP